MVSKQRIKKEKKKYNINVRTQISLSLLLPLYTAENVLISIPENLLGALHHLVQPGHLPALRLALALGDEVRRDGGDRREGHVRAVGGEGDARLGRLQRQLVRPAVQHRRLDAGRHERGVGLVRAEGELLGGRHGGRARDVDFRGWRGRDGQAWVAALGRGVREWDSQALCALDFGGLCGRVWC